MQFYIATSLSRATDHNVVRDALKTHGHNITYDWSIHGSVKLVSKDRLREVATLELNAITNADFLVVLLPGGKGTHVELGHAIASGKQVFLHSTDPETFELGPEANAFYHHPEVTQIVCPIIELSAKVHLALTQPVSQMAKNNVHLEQQI